MTVSSGYEIPASTTRVETLVLNSRFITTAACVESVDTARAFIHAMREEMPDANHHVYAFRVGHGGTVTEGMSDDGEPSGTSGPPTLAVLRGSDIGDIVVVTTRYFGGTKLGTGGLTRAYGDAVKAVLAALPVVRKIRRVNYALELPYPLYELTLRLLANHEVIINDQVFAETATVYYSIAEEHIPAVLAEVTELSAGAISPTLLD